MISKEQADKVIKYIETARQEVNIEIYTTYYYKVNYITICIYINLFFNWTICYELTLNFDMNFKLVICDVTLIC